MKSVTFYATKKLFQSAPISTQLHFDERRQRFVVGGREYEAIEVQENGKTVDYRLGALIEKDDKGGERKGARVPLNIVASDTFLLRHGNSFDMDDPGDAFMVSLWLDNQGVAKSLREVNGEYHRMYLEDPHSDAKATLQRNKLKLEAHRLVGKLEEKDFRDFAFADGRMVLAQQMDSDMAQAYLIEELEKDPARVLAMLQDSTFRAKAFLNKLVQYGLVAIHGGQYRFGNKDGEVFGIDLQAAVAFLIDPKNKLTVKNLHNQLKDRGETVQGEVEVESKP